MKKILIVNLRRLGDVYTSAHLVNSITQNDETEVSMLVFTESKKAALNLANVKNIYTIDREELITITNNKLFTDSSALDRLYDSLIPIKETHWDSVVNFSNDTTGAYLCSYFKNNTNEVVGVHFNQNRNVVTNSIWEIVFNDVITSVKFSPIHFVDCYHRMLNIPVANTGLKILTNSEHNDNASASFQNIRRGNDAEDSFSKIIGIQLSASTEAKSIPTETLNEYIELLKLSTNLIPILLIAPNNEERMRANLINETFNNNLIVVEADLTALASVVANLDLVITPDTVTKHIADLINTPVIEVSLGEAPFLKQGTYNSGSLILSDVLSVRNFSSNVSTATNITANDIYASTIFYFSNTKSIRPNLSPGVTLYKVTKDNIGITFVPISGTVEAQNEIQRLMARLFVSSLIETADGNNTYQDIINLGVNDALAFTTNEKAIITETMKDLLGTLRALLQSLETKRSSRDFVISLGKLIAHSEVDSVSQIASIIFKTKLEGIQARSFEENAKEVEVLLYELKSYLQRNLNSIKNLEEKIALHKQEVFMQRNNQTIG